MPVASSSISQSLGGGVWEQIQQLQAQRNADQAEQRARVLQDKAREAQSVADRAQENARSLKVQSSQADGEASRAQRGLAGIDSMSETQGKLSDLREQIGNVLTSETLDVPEVAAALPPVVNAFGQQTGTLVNVTA